MKNRSLLPQSLVVASTLCVSTASLSVEQQGGNYVWQFNSGQSWPLGYNQNTGKPDQLTYNRGEYTPEFFQRIANALPESRVNEAFITGDQGSTIHLSEDAEVFITFIHEGAGYKNSFGYFTFDPENPPQSPEEVQETIVFPNLSYPHLTNGHRVSIGEFPAGTSIGFFIAANGFWYYTGVKPFRVPYYYSLSNLNPEADESLKQHCVLLYDEEQDEVVIGFEDLPRTWGDNDFNDALFSVKSSPASAIAATNLNPMPESNDSDADGVPDDQDEFPNDYDRVSSQYFPSESGIATFAFEDNWPNRGDHDLNDLVVKQQIRITYDADNQVSGFILNGFITARGAANNNGFGLRLMDSEPGLIGEASIQIDGQTYEKRAEEYQSNAVITLWRNTHVFTTTGQSGSCSHFNTVMSCDNFSPVPFTLDVKFDYSISALALADFDFFLYRSWDRSWEVHMADYPPTDLFDDSRLGRKDDTSDAAIGRYFRTAENLSWGLMISEDWNYPREYIDVVWAYPDYEQWVESNGEQAQDWYLTNERTTHTYSEQ
ncbi:LruC domain-containing protein [Pseudoalteromonas sp. SCSIO 43201]|uniref:LruC domain-containing protein n=1 Tax=Pseudoalteromonas sp. SCSIO 43201 TaxID=2822842 RepID=UPI00207555BF|nr:LruC domain-containing protein [Pseudoalteromonas sp. SCSIO 43201]USD29184.1 LruC domain-containing protein [Pseudoalteromonas sp. SCSIO 43201]